MQWHVSACLCELSYLCSAELFGLFIGCVVTWVSGDLGGFDASHSLGSVGDFHLETDRPWHRQGSTVDALLVDRLGDSHRDELPCLRMVNDRSGLDRSSSTSVVFFDADLAGMDFVFQSLDVVVRLQIGVRNQFVAEELGFHLRFPKMAIRRRERLPTLAVSATELTRLQASRRFLP